MNQHVEALPSEKKKSKRPIISIWTAPRETIRHQMKHSKFGWLFLLAALAGISYFLDSASTGNLADKANASAGGIVLIGLFAGPVLGLISWVFFSAVYFGIGKLFGGESTFKEMLYAVAWSNIPIIASLLLWIPDLGIMGDGAFSQYLSDVNGFGVIIILFTSFLEIVLTVWYAVILVKGVAAAHQFSAWKGLGVIIVPGLFVLLLAILLVFVTA
ncbi:Yip1 family protein [Bacillus infantis]|uniref:Yip1 family protein n=1 Tax=Bacillus infantis TaxID=324767 RepID=UPI002FBD7032